MLESADHYILPSRLLNDMTGVNASKPAIVPRRSELLGAYMQPTVTVTGDDMVGSIYLNAAPMSPVRTVTVPVGSLLNVGMYKAISSDKVFLEAGDKIYMVSDGAPTSVGHIITSFLMRRV